jgi:hypothetical protein
MKNMDGKSVVSLGEAVITGVILDFLILLIAGTIMDGGFIASLTLFIVIGHWALNGAILFSKKARQSRAGKDFIRFGIFPLIFITFVSRLLLALLGIGF